MGIIMHVGRTLLLDVHCITCDRAVYFWPDSYPLAFHCEKGHFLTLSDLLNDALADPPAPALELWPKRSSLLRRLASQSLERGHAFAAADFQEAANRVDRWVQNLRALLSKSHIPAKRD